MKYILSFLFLICLQNCKGQNHNTTFGVKALSDSIQRRNTAIGYPAPYYNNSGASNITLGFESTADNFNMPVGHYGYYPYGDTDNIIYNGSPSDIDSFDTELMAEIGKNIYLNATVDVQGDTLIILSHDFNFITIDGQTFEIKRSVELKPVVRNIGFGHRSNIELGREVEK